MLSLHTTLISFIISTITCTNLLLQLCFARFFPHLTKYFRCRLAPHPFSRKKIFLMRIFPHFYIQLYHQLNLSSRINIRTYLLCTLTSFFTFVICFFHSKRSLFVYTVLLARERRVHVTPSIISFMFFLVNVFFLFHLLLLHFKYFTLSEGNEFISILDAFTFLFTKARACILIYFFFVFVLNFVFLDNYFCRCTDAIFVVKSFSDETRL